MTDHKKESNRIADHAGEDWISVEGMTDATMIYTAIDALRHATLYAGDQQHIANLIAYKQLNANTDLNRDELTEGIETMLGIQRIAPVSLDDVRKQERERIAAGLEDALEQGTRTPRRPSNFGRAAEYVRNIL